MNRGKQPTIPISSALIRTFWLGLAGSVLGVYMTPILIGFPIMLAVDIWVLVSFAVALMKAQQLAAMPDPQTLLI